MALWSACAFVLMLLAAPYAVGLPLHLPVIILPAALGLFAFAELLPRTSWLLRLIWIMSVAAGTAMLFCGSISPPGTCGIAQPLWRIIYAPLSEVIYHPALSGAGLRCRPGTEFALGVGLFVVSAALAGLTLHSLSARYCRSGSGVAAMLVGAAALLSAPSLGTRFQLAQFSRDFVDSATPQSEANFAKPMEADWLELISFAGSALRAVQGETMAWIEAADSSGQTRFRFPVRAGIETAEWAWDRADLRGKLAHSRAPIAESWTAEDPGLPPYLAHRYLARWPLPGDTEIASVRVDFQVHPGTRRSLALASCRLLAGAPRWQRRLHLAEPMILTPAAPFCEVELGTESAEEILLHVRLEGSGRCRRGGRVALATLTSASATWDYPIELDRHVARTRGPEGGGLRILGSLVLQAPGPAAGHWSPFRISVPPGSRPDSLRLDLSADIIAAAALRLIIGQVETGSHLAGSTSRSGPSGLAQQPLLGSNL